MARSIGMRELTFTEAAREGLAEEMERDPMVFVVGEGIGARGGNFATTVGLFERFGAERLRDTPIAERGFTGLCTGAAMAGARPVVDYMFFDFALDALGEIINQTSKIQYMSDGRLRMPIVLRGCVGIGSSAATHHSGSYYSLFAHVPGLRVVAPTTPRDAKGLLKTAIRCDDPVVFMEHRSVLSLKGPVPDAEVDELIPLGLASVRREGTDVSVVGIANTVNLALAASELLAGEGVSVEVIDPRSLAPLDIDTVLGSVARTGRLLVVDEDYAPCGVGAEIAAQVADRGFDDLDAPIRRLNSRHAPIPYSPPLERALIPTVDSIAQALRDLLAE
jgi:2-oxoisovalerate dehydrogenase E1 component